MAFDPIVANAGRLAILTTLAQQGEAAREFVELRRMTRLSDGNLSAHAKRLASAGLVEIQKRFRAGKPVTTLHLTAAGREALQTHVQRVLAAVAGRREPEISEPAAVLASSGDVEDWVD